jgi:hypothetical protein
MADPRGLVGVEGRGEATHHSVAGASIDDHNVGAIVAQSLAVFSQLGIAE